MSQEQQQQQQPPRPVTFGDVFSDVQGELAKQGIVPKDAALMQSAEALAMGRTQKGGVASVMQSAASENVKAGSVAEDAPSSIAEDGVTVAETILPGEILHTEFVGTQPVSTSSTPVPMVPVMAAMQDAITIGEALEAAAVSAGDRPITPSDASAIQSAEKRATGLPLTIPGGIAATAQAAAVLNPRVEDFSKTTLSDVLMDASSKLPCDKVVTQEDVKKVTASEQRHKGNEDTEEGVVSAALAAAADMNDKLQETLSSS